MKIEYTPTRALRPHPNKTRTHSRKPLRQIAESIVEFGFCNPVLIDDAKPIITGHGRVETAKLLASTIYEPAGSRISAKVDKRTYVLRNHLSR